MAKKGNVMHFVEDERAKGAKDKDIRHKLLDAGWHMDIIHNAMHKNDKTPQGGPVLPTTSDTEVIKRYALIGLGIFLVLVLLAVFI